jgi:hypothetical protein
MSESSSEGSRRSSCCRLGSHAVQVQIDEKFSPSFELPVDRDYALRCGPACSAMSELLDREGDDILFLEPDSEQYRAEQRQQRLARETRASEAIAALGRFGDREDDA